MTRVLYVSSAGERGGAEVVLLTILAHLDRTRFEPHVVCLQEGDLVRQMREESGIEAQVYPIGQFRRVWRGRRVVQRISQMICDRSIDVVHCNGTPAQIYGGLAAKRAHTPSIYHLHDLPDSSWTRQGLVHRLAASIPASAVIAVSHFLAEQYGSFPGSAHKTHVIHNAVELQPYRVDGDSAEGDGVRAGFGWSSDAPLVLWCGRLQHWKGAHVFVDAAARIRDRIPAARFLVVGGSLLGLEPQYSQELSRQAQSLGLDDCLRFTGHVSDVRPFLSAADVVVHSSLRPEPFGLVVLESMALEKAVVAPAAGGPIEMIEPGVSGSLVPPGDVEAIASAVVRLLGDDDLRRSMGQAARKRAVESFDVAQMMQRLEGLYDRVAGATGRGGKEHRATRDRSGSDALAAAK
jgi:glycosyltransferase involved in cell wall biosynthesis